MFYLVRDCGDLVVCHLMCGCSLGFLICFNKVFCCGASICVTVFLIAVHYAISFFLLSVLFDFIDIKDCFRSQGLGEVLRK